MPCPVVAEEVAAAEAAAAAARGLILATRAEMINSTHDLVKRMLELVS